MQAGNRWWAMPACALVLALSGACNRTDPEEVLRTRFAALQQAVEARDAGDVADFLAEDFIGNEGMDRDAARRLAAGMFLRHRQVGVASGPLQVRMHGQDSASLQFDAALTGGSGGMLPQQAQWYRVETGWRLQDGEWRMISAQWSPRLK